MIYVVYFKNIIATTMFIENMLYFYNVIAMKLVTVPL